MAIFAKITNVQIPSTAKAGDQVIVDVSVTNIGFSDWTIGMTALVNGANLPFQFDWVTVPSGGTVIFRGYFTMPPQAATVQLWTFFWDNLEWVQDDYAEKVVQLTFTLAGKITDKWVNKSPEGSRLPMPATVKADGNTFEVGVSYRNDSPVNIVGGVEVSVIKPNLSTVTPAIDWANMSPGKTLSKEYNISKVDQTGVWGAVIRFLAE
jgi:hypothetical protein